TKSFVEMHGGQIRAESAGRGQGAVFTFELDTIKASPAMSREKPVPAQPNASSLSILVIEDHDATAQMLAHILGKKHAVQIAHRCTEAREFLEKKKYDL